MPGLETKDEQTEKSVLFRRALTDLSAEHHEQYMLDLARKINDQGQKLVGKADIHELQKYRELIREFLNETVSNSYTFHKESGFEARRRHKIFATINKINTKLEELAQEVLKEQSDNLEILHKVDDIRGLILDIML